VAAAGTAAQKRVGAKVTIGCLNCLRFAAVTLSQQKAIATEAYV
jgi:hypothetical protein